MITYQLKPSSRYWPMIIIGSLAFGFLFKSTPFLINEFIKGPQIIFGIIWFGGLTFVFIKWVNNFLGSEIIKVNKDNLTYRRTPFGLVKKFKKRDIEFITSQWQYMTDIELKGASKMGVSQWRLHLRHKNKEHLIGRYLTKDQSIEIIEELEKNNFEILVAE